MKKKKLLPLLVAMTLAGCISTSEVTQVGKDTYTMGTSAHGGLQSKAEILQITLRKASDYCAAMGKKMQLSHTDTSGIQGWTPVETDIVFNCLSEDDPAYGRVKEHRDIGTVQITQ